MSDEDVVMNELAPNSPPQAAQVAAAAVAEQQQPIDADVETNPTVQLASSQDQNNSGDESSDEESEYQTQSFAHSVFSSAEAGYAIAIFRLLSNLEDEDTKTTILNQVLLAELCDVLRN